MDPEIKLGDFLKLMSDTTQSQIVLKDQDGANAICTTLKGSYIITEALKDAKVKKWDVAKNGGNVIIDIDSYGITHSSE